MASGVGDVGFLLGDGAGVDQRADVGIVLAAADGEGGGGLGEAAAEVGVDRALDQEAVGAEAVLAGGGELGLDGLGDGAVEVGVGEDQEGRVAAELQHQALHGVGGLAVEQAADLGRAGEGEDADAAGPRSRRRTMVGASPVTTLKTPAGSRRARRARPARAPRTASRRSGGSTTVQPAASAAAALRVIIAQGKFQGVTRAATPAGSRQSSTSASCRCEVTPSMFGRRASSA